VQAADEPERLRRPIEPFPYNQPATNSTYRRRIFYRRRNVQEPEERPFSRNRFWWRNHPIGRQSFFGRSDSPSADEDEKPVVKPFKSRRTLRLEY
jgi:hypothetical protein